MAQDTAAAKTVNGCPQQVAAMLLKWFIQSKSSSTAAAT